ncbi:type II toxin-antitoxin system HicB family antitoxin [Acidithiobacillus sp. M4-SHS-6]|uniref:type II toxin-antitoxin system HicB family antitoxin n=1 Tax=Acidithiobacillus sp. M4-SHS-6 TaxID=3383024 RepID=UPI0039BE316E
MRLHVEYEQEEDGRWIAEIPELPGVMCYGVSRTDAAAKVEAMALRAIAERLDEGEMAASPITIETMERAQA